MTRIHTWAAALLTTALAVSATPAAATVKAGVEKYMAGDYKGAMVEWLPYAARGDADALFNLGQLYKLGRGVGVNLSTAMDYYRKAAAKGHAPAASNLGTLLYQSGDKVAAARFWQQAAAKGDARAQHMLGILYFNGDTVSKDWPLAYAYVLRAQAGGVAQANAALETMNAHMPPAVRKRGEEIAATLAAGGAPPIAQVDAQSLPKPADTSASPSDAAEAAPTTSGEWRVQLGAFSHKDTANKTWLSLKASQEALFGTVAPIFVEANNMVRLQLGPYPSREEAKRVCEKLSAIGRACFVVTG